MSELTNCQQHNEVCGYAQLQKQLQALAAQNKVMWEALDALCRANLKYGYPR